MDLLLLSNSRSPDGSFLTHAAAPIAEITRGRKRAFFVPFASVTASWDDFAARVGKALEPAGLAVGSAHAGAVLDDAEVIVVGGGNSFNLLRECRHRGLLAAIAAKVRAGVPYIGWSAGANLSCPTICTTNDMPIVDCGGLDALGLIDFQINPHFTDAMPAGHQGETRRQRLAEYLVANPAATVLGLPEGDWVEIHDTTRHLRGPHPAFLFRAGVDAASLAPDSAL